MTEYIIDSRQYLGRLCKSGHEFKDSGKSLRNKINRYCIVCNKLERQKKYQDEKNADVMAFRLKEQEKRDSQKERRLLKLGKYGNPDRKPVTSDELRAVIFDILGRRCTRCGFSDVRALQFDHINGGGTQEVKELGSVTRMYKRIIEMNGDGYQVLCANCNQIKRIEKKENHKAVLDR